MLSRVSSHIPRSGLVAAWANAYLAGEVSLDEASIGIVAIDDLHRVEVDDESVAWSIALGGLRSQGVTSLRLLLPAPGDVVDLPGPADFNRRAVATGECVVTQSGPALALLPEVETSDDGVVFTTWTLEGTNTTRPLNQSTSEAMRELMSAMSEGAQTLERLDVARGRDSAADALAEIDAELSRLILPPSLPPRAVELISRGTRLLGAIGLAQRGEGAAVTSAEISARAGALSPMAAAARHAIACGYSARG
jgi:hypothetical protein